MQLPLTNPDTLFEELLQDLPPETVQMARAFKAFVRAKKVKTPAQLLRVVFLYCGLDKSLREVAGTFTALYESMTDQAVAERLRACGPWVKAMLRRMLPLSAVETLPQGRRFVVIDASSIQAPGATGTDHRLHIAMDLVSLQFLEVLVSDVHTGETLKHFTLAPGDVAVANRGYAHCQGMSAAVQQGADLIVRLNPFSVVLRDAVGGPLELCATLKRQHTETLRTLAVELCATGGQHEVRGWVHAYRLNAEQANRARQKCRQGRKKGTPTLARVLQLSADERAYLFALARRPLPPAPALDIHPVRPVLQTLLAALEPYPANLRDDRWYVLAWNRAESLIADWAALPPAQRHVVWNHFTNLRLRQMLVDWSGDARTQLALFRMASRRHAGAAWLADFSDRLQQVSPEFRTWWSQHEVQQQRERAIVMQHPRVGRLVLERVAFVVEANPSLSLRVLLPLPDADTAAKLQRLWAEPG